MKFKAKMARNNQGDVFPYWQVTDENGGVVADLFGETGKQNEDGEDEYMPDEQIAMYAHLIEAAPDLLEVARRVIMDDPDSPSCGCDESGHCLWHMAYSALNKANASVLPQLRTLG